MDVAGWKAKVKKLTSVLTDAKKEYDSILNDWADIRDEAGDPGKHEVDKCFSELSSVRDGLCALRGGKKAGRNNRKQRRTRRN
jgi:hypothetical protein